MSSTRAPRLRSLTGLARPWSIGPMLITWALRCTALYVVLPVSRSGKMKTLARPATGMPGRLAWPTEAMAAASYCSGPSTAVDLALPEHHGADRDRVGEMLAGDLLGPALVPPQLGQRGDEPLGGGPRVQHADPLGQPQAQVPGLRGHLVRGTEQQAAGDAAAGAVGRGAERAGFGALGQDDERIGGPGLLHQLVAERGGGEPSRPGGAEP